MAAPAMQAPARLGGTPTVDLDVPILAVFLALFIGLAACKMTILQRNNKRGHKFLLSGLLFGFCMSRIAACVMRIVWSTRPMDVNVSIASAVFLNAGILIIYIVNNILAQRILRSALPKVGWNPIVRNVHKVMLFLLLPLLIMQIATIVQQLTTSDNHTKIIDHDIQLGPLCYLLFISFLPFVLIAIAVIVPRLRGDDPSNRDHFGSGSWRTKIICLLLTTAAGCTEAGFRTGTTFMPNRPASDPAWYQSKAAFYCFNFTLDILALSVFLIARIDLTFHVRDKANGPGQYSEPLPQKESKTQLGAETGDEKGVVNEQGQESSHSADSKLSAV